jgi:hypothetical protein
MEALVVDEDDGVRRGVGGGDVDDEVGGAAAFAAVGEDALKFVFTVDFYHHEAEMGVLEGGDVYVGSADCDVDTWRWQFNRRTLRQSVYSQYLATHVKLLVAYNPASD